MQQAHCSQEMGKLDFDPLDARQKLTLSLAGLWLGQQLEPSL